MHDADSLAPHLQKDPERRASALKTTGISGLGTGLGLGLALVVGAGCGGSSDSMLLVNVSKIPTGAVKLTVKASLNGKAAAMGREITGITPPTGSFGVAVPASTAGELELDLDAQDATGCVLATAELDDITVPAQRVDMPLAVEMVAADTTKCTTMPPPTCTTLLCAYTPKPQIQNISNLWAISASDIWGVGSGGNIVHYDGTSWTKNTTLNAGSGGLTAVWASGPSDVWVVGGAGYIGRYNGTSWSPSSNGAVDTLNGIYGLGPSNIWAVGENYLGGRPEFWRWNGSSWSNIDPGYNGALTGVWASSATDIHACGDGGFLLHYTGGSWGKVSGTTADLRAIWGANANQVFAVGSGGTVLFYSTASGWGKLNNSGTSANLNALFGDGTNVFAVGDNGVLVRSVAPFNNFTASTTGISTDLFAIQPTGNGIGWVAGAGGYLASYNLAR